MGYGAGPGVVVDGFAEPLATERSCPEEGPYPVSSPLSPLFLHIPAASTTKAFPAPESPCPPAWTCPSYQQTSFQSLSASCSSSSGVGDDTKTLDRCNWNNISFTIETRLLLTSVVTRLLWDTIHYVSCTVFYIQVNKSNKGLIQTLLYSKLNHSRTHLHYHCWVIHSAQWRVSSSLRWRQSKRSLPRPLGLVSDNRHCNHCGQRAGDITFSAPQIWC